MHCTVFVLLAMATCLFSVYKAQGVCFIIYCMYGVVCVLLPRYATSLFTVCMTQCVCCWLGVALPYELLAWPSVCVVGCVCYFLINSVHRAVFVLLAVYVTSLLTVCMSQCLCCWLCVQLPY